MSRFPVLGFNLDAETSSKLKFGNKTINSSHVFGQGCRRNA